MTRVWYIFFLLKFSQILEWRDYKIEHVYTNNGPLLSNRRAITEILYVAHTCIISHMVSSWCNEFLCWSVKSIRPILTLIKSLIPYGICWPCINHILGNLQTMCNLLILFYQIKFSYSRVLNCIWWIKIHEKTRVMNTLILTAW